MIFFCGMACAVAYAIYCGISADMSRKNSLRFLSGILVALLV